MALVIPTPVTALPAAPSASNSSSFDTLADGYVGALPTHRAEMNALAANVYNNAVEIASTIGASSRWTVGTYSTGVVKFSPLDGKNYRCIVATTGADVTDPSSDFVKWKVVIPNVPGNIIYIAQIYGVF